MIRACAAGRSPLLIGGLTIIGALAAVALLAPAIAPYDPNAISGPALDPPSVQHLIGTDVPGRDLLSQLIWGARASMLVAVPAAFLAMAGGVVLGVVPALLGGHVDATVRRIVLLALAIPVLPLLVLAGSLAGDSRIVVISILGLLGAIPNARILRSQTLTLRQRGYVATARGFGAGPVYVLRRHLGPELGPLLVVGLVNWASAAVGLEAGLAFLGIGDLNGVSWGLTINRALSEPGIYFSTLWVWWVLPAGLAITLTVLGFTFVGVGLEPTFNPRAVRAS